MRWMNEMELTQIASDMVAGLAHRPDDDYIYIEVSTTNRDTEYYNEITHTQGVPFPVIPARLERDAMRKFPYMFDTSMSYAGRREVSFRFSALESSGDLR